MNNHVFKRTTVSSSLLSDTLYNFIIGLTLCWGFLINWLLVTFIDTALIRDLDLVLFIASYLISVVIGTFLYELSKNPLISFLGYNLVVVPIGVLFNLCLSGAEPNLVINAIRVTGIVTLAMMCLGILFPKFFISIERALAGVLCLVIVIELMELILFGIHHEIIDWVVAIAFCGYIGIDWVRANQIPKTLDNAIDSAAALYMDIINIFARLLSILHDGKSDNDSIDSTDSGDSND